MICNNLKAALATAAVITTGLAIAADESDSRDIGKRLSDAHVARFSEGGMQRWQEHMTPGLAHEFLAEHFVGTFKTTATQVFEGNKGPEFTWVAEGKPILGGRYIEQRAEGEMMGMPVESMMIVGYDNMRKLFHATMFDSMGTGVKTLWGNLDRTGKVLTLVGEMDEPMTGEVAKSFMIAWTFNDDGTQSYEIREILYGESFPVIIANSKPMDVN